MEDGDMSNHPCTKPDPPPKVVPSKQEKKQKTIADTFWQHHKLTETTENRKEELCLHALRETPRKITKNGKNSCHSLRTLNQ
jgi:hypothetical protein